MSYSISLGTGDVPATLYDAVANHVLILAHGAGAGQAHPFMKARGEALKARGVTVVTFDFQYMAAKKKMPDRQPTLEKCYEAVLKDTRARFPNAAIAIGGKSMGGRMATYLAARRVAEISGVVCLGYPLHPPKEPEKLRVQHLPDIGVPCLFVQGERDAFGSPDALKPYLPASATLLPIASADHSFATPKSVSAKDTLQLIDDAVARFVLSIG